jgi:hypothetical protein
MTSLSEIDTQPASMLVCDHLICQSCGIVDRDYGRLRNGYCCSECGVKSESGRLVFPISIHVLVDLVQQAFHSQSPTGPLDAPQGSDIGTVLFYCTLREALLNTFLRHNLRARQVDESLITKLLDDNKLASQKFGGLFTSVIGATWEDAIAQASRLAGTNFKPVSDLMRKAAELRNEFLHEGRAWSLNREFATECVDSMGNLVNLFVALHNEYTHPVLQGKPSPDGMQ